ncbi:MAG: DUF2789 family protein [Fluviibacter phosphoraccumulans]|jgi:hypothetical protein
MPSILLGFIIKKVSKDSFMSRVHHSLEDLLAQLGLCSDSESIENFIDYHWPIPNEVALFRATESTGIY